MSNKRARFSGKIPFTRNRRDHWQTSTESFALLLVTERSANRSASVESEYCIHIQERWVLLGSENIDELTRKETYKEWKYCGTCSRIHISDQFRFPFDTYISTLPVLFKSFQTNLPIISFCFCSYRPLCAQYADKQVNRAANPSLTFPFDSFPPYIFILWSVYDCLLPYKSYHIQYIIRFSETDNIKKSLGLSVCFYFCWARIAHQRHQYLCLCTHIFFI